MRYLVDATLPDWQIVRTYHGQRTQATTNSAPLMTWKDPASRQCKPITEQDCFVAPSQLEQLQLAGHVTCSGRFRVVCLLSSPLRQPERNSDLPMRNNPTNLHFCWPLQIFNQFPAAQKPVPTEITHDGPPPSPPLLPLLPVRLRQDLRRNRHLPLFCRPTRPIRRNRALRLHLHPRPRRQTNHRHCHHRLQQTHCRSSS